MEVIQHTVCQNMLTVPSQLCPKFVASADNKGKWLKKEMCGYKLTDQKKLFVLFGFLANTVHTANQPKKTTLIVFDGW